MTIEGIEIESSAFSEVLDTFLFFSFRILAVGDQVFFKHFFISNFFDFSSNQTILFYNLQ